MKWERLYSLKSASIIKGKEKLWTCSRLKIKTIRQLHAISAPKLDFVLSKKNILQKTILDQ